MDQQRVEEAERVGEGAPKGHERRAGAHAKRRGFDYSEIPRQKKAPALQLSEEQWRARLDDEEYSILRENGTERPRTGELLGENRDGTYVCAGCGEVLFSSAQKYDSRTGWPSFWALAEGSTVGEALDESLGMTRVEVYCTHCGGHLGHVFDDGPEPTGLRYCINSLAMDFEPAAAGEERGEEGEDAAGGTGE